MRSLLTLAMRIELFAEFVETIFEGWVVGEIGEWKGFETTGFYINGSWS